MCCGKSPRVAEVRGLTKLMTSNTMMRAPQGEMVLVEYTGKNFGSQTWGGPGAVPTGSYYVFGAAEKDRMKYVRPDDVAYFLAYRQGGNPLFKRADLPVAEPLKLKTVQVGGELTPVGELGGNNAEGTVAQGSEAQVAQLDNEAVPAEPTAEATDEEDELGLSEAQKLASSRPRKKVQKFGKS